MCLPWRVSLILAKKPSEVLTCRRHWYERHHSRKGSVLLHIFLNVRFYLLPRLGNTASGSDRGSYADHLCLAPLVVACARYQDLGTKLARDRFRPVCLFRLVCDPSVSPSKNARGSRFTRHPRVLWCLYCRLDHCRSGYLSYLA